MSLVSEQRILIEFTKIKSFNSNNQKRALENFHARHKYLYFTYHQGLKNKLGQIVGNHEKLSVDEMINTYEYYLNQLLREQPTVKNKINAYEHMYGYFKRDLTKDEKEYYNSLKLSFISGECDECCILSFLKKLAEKHHMQYILNQSIILGINDG